MSKWPDPKDPSATFYSERAYKNYRSSGHGSHNSPARKNPEVPLFDAMADFEKTYKKAAKDKKYDEVLRNLLWI